jgi:LPS-assembly lipoprotein
LLSKPRLCLSRRAAFCGVLALAGCGFTPVYAPGGAGDLLQNNIAFTSPETVDGYVLRQRLVDRFGRASTPDFTLEVQLSSERDAATVTTDGDTTRFDIIGIAAWTLIEVATGTSRTGRAQTFTSYSTTGSTVATQTAETDAERRLSVALADLIGAQLITAVTAQ